MNSAPPKVFSSPPSVVVELPLAPNARILQPEQVIVKIGKQSYDFGTYCYTLRSDKRRRPLAHNEVVLESFLPKRTNQVHQLIKVFSCFLNDEGLRQSTVQNLARQFDAFMDWADAVGHYDCLAGGEATRSAYQAYVAEIEKRHQRHEVGTAIAAQYQKGACTVLQALTGLEDLSRGLRLIGFKRKFIAGTEPASEDEFAHALALNNALFNGLSDLVLDLKSFPFKLDMPKSLGWQDSFLWIFPVNLWRLPPHLRGEARKSLGSNENRAYNYDEGRISTVDEIWHLYRAKSPSDQRSHARNKIRNANATIEAANHDPRHLMRIKLAKHAHNAFLFLFFANTGCNFSVVQGIETDGSIDASTTNQGFRSIKWRAQGKEINTSAPVTFMPQLRRFMDLRRFLLNEAAFPYLFFTQENPNIPPMQLKDSALDMHYRYVLRAIDPKLPIISARKIRATVQDYYRRNYDAAISARLMQHSDEVANKHYAAGSPTDHHEDMTRFLTEVSKRAKEQQVLPDGAELPEARSLEEGGACALYGHPEPLGEYIPVKPNCPTGCLFCANRILVANERDARKVASAAYVMEQLILGPLSEAEFRPQIQKCDEDLKKIAAFDGCLEMVERVKLDVFENGNLTSYFADKFQLFLELGVL